MRFGEPIANLLHMFAWKERGWVGWGGEWWWVGWGKLRVGVALDCVGLLWVTLACFAFLCFAKPKPRRNVGMRNGPRGKVRQRDERAVGLELTYFVSWSRTTT